MKNDGRNGVTEDPMNIKTLTSTLIEYKISRALADEAWAKIAKNFPNFEESQVEQLLGIFLSAAESETPSETQKSVDKAIESRKLPVLRDRLIIVMGDDAVSISEVALRLRKRRWLPIKARKESLPQYLSFMLSSEPCFERVKRGIYRVGDPSLRRIPYRPATKANQVSPAKVNGVSKKAMSGTREAILASLFQWVMSTHGQLSLNVLDKIQTTEVPSKHQGAWGNYQKTSRKLRPKLIQRYQSSLGNPFV